MSDNNSITQPVGVEIPQPPPIVSQPLQVFLDRVQARQLEIIRRYVQDEDKVEDLHSELTMLQIRVLINPPPEKPAAG
jgi:hypothetical protein